MKRLTINFVLFVSIKALSQDSTLVKRFSLGAGLTWGSANWGGNVNVSYTISKKFSLKLRSIYDLGKDNIFANQSSYSAGIQIRPTTDISISTNYFLFGNTNQNCKAALYIGLGYLQQTSNTTNLYPGNLLSSNNTIGSYIEKNVSRGLAANTSIGAAFKLGPGKLYVEAYFAISFIGETTTSFTFMNQFTSPLNPPQLQVNKYKQDFDPQAILCFSFGYSIPF
jgi:hypothetical protein